MTNNSIGVVAIGRNEGDRLKRCLGSVRDGALHVVYVDSGSSDDSVSYAESQGVHVVRLDMSRPFAAARARNAGFERLMELDPTLEYVLFVDGDCEMIDGFLRRAVDCLEAHPEYVLVAGRRIERHPDDSIFNRLCDLEWNTTVGENIACGGESVIRAKAFRDVGMFRPDMIAGEEPELCVRLRKAGGTVYRIEADMSYHDAAITRLGQWCKRAERSGHAYAEGRALHGEAPWRHNVKSLRSILVWSLWFPLAFLGFLLAMVWWPPAGLGAVLIALLYPVQWWRIFRYRRRRGDPGRHAALYATFTVLGKWPQLAGALSYWMNRLRGRQRGLIEYK